MRLFLAPFLLAAGFTACVSQQQPAPNGPPGMTPASSDGSGSGSNMVCTEEAPTGSSITRTVCRPKADFDEKDGPGIMNTMERGNPSGQTGPGSPAGR
jgi:hypothetical protein